MKRLFAIGLTAAMLAAPWHAPASADNGARRSIRVQGTGSVDAKPDQAVIMAAVVDQETAAARALEANSESMRRVLAKLGEFAVAKSDIQTRSFAVHPLFERRVSGTATPRIIGYRVVNRIAVKVRELARLGAMLDALVAAGADRLDGVRFSIAAPEPLADKARLAAMADAHRKAELYAESAGVRVGRVLDIAEHGARGPRPAMMEAAAMSARAAVPIEAGEQRVSAAVTVVYEIE